MEAWQAQGPGRTSYKIKGWRLWSSRFLKNRLQGMKSIKEGNQQGKERLYRESYKHTHKADVKLLPKHKGCCLRNVSPE